MPPGNPIPEHGLDTAERISLDGENSMLALWLSDRSKKADVQHLGTWTWTWTLVYKLLVGSYL